MLSQVKSRRPITRFIFGFSYLFLYLPIVVLIIYSFNSKAIPSPWESFTFRWYHELFQHEELWGAFFTSFFIATTSTVLCLIMSILMILCQTLGTRIEQYVPLFYGNLVIPETVLAIALISYFTLLHIPLGLTTIIIAHTALGLGFTLPVLFLRYKELDSRIIEASLVLGASKWQTFVRIVLPFMRPALFMTALLVYVLSFDDFILTYFCSGTSTTTLSLFLVMSLRYQISPVINALATLLLLLTSILIALFFSFKRTTKAF